MAIYVTRYCINAGAINVPAAVNLDAGGAVNPIQAPSGVSKIVAIGMCLTDSIQSVANAGTISRISISGTGVKGGTHELPIGGASDDNTSTSGTYISVPTYMPVDIDIVAGNIIDITTVQEGVDSGSPTMAVTLVMA